MQLQIGAAPAPAASRQLAPTPRARASRRRTPTTTPRERFLFVCASALARTLPSMRCAANCIRYAQLTGPTNARNTRSTQNSLAKLGFKPQLKREFHWITSLAVSFTIVSVLTGLTGLYGLGYQYGGPAMITWSWPVCVALTTTVAMALAELASAMPTAGGVYFWAWAVAPRRARALAAWLTLWFNFIGLVGVQAGINYTFVVTLQAAVQLGGGPRFTPSVQYAVYVGVTAVHALINMVRRPSTLHSTLAKTSDSTTRSAPLLRTAPRRSGIAPHHHAKPHDTPPHNLPQRMRALPACPASRTLHWGNEPAVYSMARRGDCGVLRRAPEHRPSAAVGRLRVHQIPDRRRQRRHRRRVQPAAERPHVTVHANRLRGQRKSV